MNKQTYQLANKLNERMNKWMDGWMDQRMNEWCFSLALKNTHNINTTYTARKTEQR